MALIDSAVGFVTVVNSGGDMSFLKLLVSSPPETHFRGNFGGEEYVCWSRMQAEAGETLHAIVARKERERRSGGGVFLWGVGNAPSTAISALVHHKIAVPVIFSTMKSKPKMADVAPSRTFVWRQYIDGCGIERPLPKSALVTSRGDSARGSKTRHHALVCYSASPLALVRGVPFDPTAFRNAGGAGGPVGASQVTALLRQVAEPRDAPDYEANLIAWLTDGYWVRLSDPQELSEKWMTEISNFDGEIYEWQKLVEHVRGQVAISPRRMAQGELLL